MLKLLSLITESGKQTLLPILVTDSQSLQSYEITGLQIPKAQGGSSQTGG